MADQGSLFDKNAKPARVGPSDATADRGHGAAAGHVAREAVRQDAVDHGSADPDSLWTQRQRARSKRAAEEHRAIGADHAELFVFTPGSQLVASKPVDPFKGFSVQWDRARDAALAGYGGLDEGRIRLFLNARSVAATREGDGHRVTVDLAGYRFTATGTTLLDALDALSRRTSKGIERAEGLAPKQAVAPTALELANARRSPEERLERAAYGYFLSRKLTFTKSRDRHLSFALNDEDVRQAELIGVAGPADRGAHDAIVAFFQAIDARTLSAQVEGWDGLTKEAFGAEGLERTSNRVASIEGLRTSRYVDDGAAPPPVFPQTPGRPPAPGRSSLPSEAPGVPPNGSVAHPGQPAASGGCGLGGPATAALLLLLAASLLGSVDSRSSVGRALGRVHEIWESCLLLRPTAHDPPEVQVDVAVQPPIRNADVVYQLTGLCHLVPATTQAQEAGHELGLHCASEVCLQRGSLERKADHHATCELRAVTCAVSSARSLAWRESRAPRRSLTARGRKASAKAMPQVSQGCRDGRHAVRTLSNCGVGHGSAHAQEASHG